MSWLRNTGSLTFQMRLSESLKRSVSVLMISCSNNKHNKREVNRRVSGRGPGYERGKRKGGGCYGSVAAEAGAV